MLKKNFMKKIIVLFMATAMLAVSGCSHQAAEETQTTESKQAEVSTEAQQEEERETLTVAIQTDTNIEDYETNYYTQRLEEAANVDLEFILMPAPADYGQKLSMMLNSGEELPDIFIGGLFNKDAQLLYGPEGYILPLTEYLNDPEVMPKFYENVPEEDRELMISHMTLADGNVYSAPFYMPALANEYPCRAWINVEWLEAIDKEMPTTTDEFYEVLKAFKEQDPNGNGIADEIPMAGASTGWYCQPLSFLMNPFEYVSNQAYMNVEDGKVYAAFVTDEWKEGLTYINKLVSEELLSPLSYTQEKAQLSAMVQNPDTQILGCYVSGGIMNTAGASTESFEPLPPLTGPDGTCWVTYEQQLPDGRMIITKDCENVDAALRLMDAFYDRELSKIARDGEPGVDWTDEVPEEGYMLRYEGVVSEIGWIELTKIWGTVQNKHWNTYGPMYMGKFDSWSHQAIGLPEEGGAYSASMMTGKSVTLHQDKYPEERIIKLIHADVERTEFTDLKSAIDTYVAESSARFMVGELPLSEWDSYVKTLEDIGLEHYIELTQKAYENGMN